MMRCKFECNGNEPCEYECSLEFNQCQDQCPCYYQCKDGCHNCSHDTCTCAYPEENADYIKCAEQGDGVYSACINQCSIGDMNCVAQCGREYEIFMEKCPCQERFDFDFKTYKFQAFKLESFKPLKSLDV